MIKMKRMIDIKEKERKDKEDVDLRGRHQLQISSISTRTKKCKHKKRVIVQRKKTLNLWGEYGEEAVGIDNFPDWLIV